MLCEVQSDTFFVVGDTQPHDRAHRLEQNKRTDESEDSGHDDSLELDPQLQRVPIEQAVCPCGINRFGRLDAGGDGTPRAADAVHAEGIE